MSAWSWLKKAVKTVGHAIVDIGSAAAQGTACLAGDLPACAGAADAVGRVIDDARAAFGHDHASTPALALDQYAALADAAWNTLDAPPSAKPYWGGATAQQMRHMAARIAEHTEDTAPGHVEAAAVAAGNATEKQVGAVALAIGALWAAAAAQLEKTDGPAARINRAIMAAADAADAEHVEDAWRQLTSAAAYQGVPVEDLRDAATAICESTADTGVTVYMHAGQTLLTDEDQTIPDATSKLLTALGDHRPDCIHVVAKAGRWDHPHSVWVKSAKDTEDLRKPASMVPLAVGGGLLWAFLRGAG